MKIIIAGGGSVGISIASALNQNTTHDIVIIDHRPDVVSAKSIVCGTWILGDACDPAVQQTAGAADADVLVSATGDDQANLVASLIAKTEFGVRRTVARINHPSNDWLFDDSWGVDVAVSTPQMMTSMVEEAVEIGEIVPLFKFAQSSADIIEYTLPVESSIVGKFLSEIIWPTGVTLCAIVRGKTPFVPTSDDTFETGDELLFLADRETDTNLRELLK